MKSMKSKFCVYPNSFVIMEKYCTMMAHDLSVEIDTEHEVKRVLFGNKIIDINYFLSTALDVHKGVHMETGDSRRN